MIAVIGGVKTTVNLKMTPPERDIEKQKKQDEEALLQAGIDINSMGNEGGSEADPAEARFNAYYQQKMREQAGENYWDEVGTKSRDFGGYDIYNPEEVANINVSLNGCAYTVARLLGAKAADVAFVSVVGNDALGLAAKSELADAGVDISGIETMEGSTAVGLEIHNILGDLEFCRENSELLNAVTPEVIETHGDILDKADAIFVDGSLPVETLDCISGKYSGKCRIYFDPGSIYGGNKYARSQLKADCVMPGRMEAEAMTRRQVLSIDQLMSAGQTLEERGVSRIVITLKGGGLYYMEGAESGMITPETNLSFAETRGAGDVLSAELMYRLEEGDNMKTAAQAAMDAAAEFLNR